MIQGKHPDLVVVHLPGAEDFHQVRPEVQLFAEEENLADAKSFWTCKNVLSLAEIEDLLLGSNLYQIIEVPLGFFDVNFSLLDHIELVELATSCHFAVNR